MTREEEPQAGSVLKSIAIPVYVIIGAFLANFLTKILFTPILKSMLAGDFDSVKDILVGYIGIGLIALILYLPMRLIFWLILKLYDYANSRPSRNKRQEPVLVVQLFGKRFINIWLSVGVGVGLIAYWLEGGF